MRGFAQRIICACGICCVAALAAHAQYPFGKNKVLYVPKDWKYLETPHLEIYYYPDELSVAEFIASLADSVYAEYAAYFAVEFKTRIPVVLYGTHHDFKETNVTPYLVSESTAGFTEFVKGRIALPFGGSYPKLRKVFRHEMVHAFMIEKLRAVMSAHRHLSYNEPPLWFVEGLAEYVANRGPDTEAHMFLRDAVMEGILAPLDDIWRIEGTFLMYKEGESAVGYLATRFGDGSIRLILERWWQSDRFDVVLQKTLGIPLRRLSEDWEESLKRRYFPAILERQKIDEIGQRLVSGETAFEVYPACDVRGGDSARAFCIGYNRGSIDILELRHTLRRERREKIFVRGGQSNDFESIPPLRSRISVRGDTLLFVSKAGPHDAIYLYDIPRRRVLKKISIAGLRILDSPTLSPDGRSVACSAIDGTGKSDLYVYDLAADTCERLTDDYYDDMSPDWNPVSDLLVFSSDRCGRIGQVSYALYTIDMKTRVIAPLTAGGARDLDPRWLPRGNGVIFSSDREGVPDIYILRGSCLSRQTNVTGGAFGPYPADDGKSFLCSAYSHGAFRCYRVPLKEDAPAHPVTSPSCVASPWQPALPPGTVGIVKKDYRMKLGLDVIGATFSVDPDFGDTGNGAQLFFTDMLGNHEFAVLFGSASDNFDDLLDGLNVAVTYVNLSHRLNYAVGAFHLASYVGSLNDLLRYERRYGVLGGLIYPLSAFSRVEFTTVLKNMERDDDIAFRGLAAGKSWLLSNFVSATNDNIVWYIGGPLNGHRLNVALGSTVDLKGRGYGSTTLNVDLRNYITLTDRIVFAQRLVSRSAWGSDLQLFYLGGAWDLRGYDFREFAGKRTLLINNELRFPLIDRFLLKFPVGLIEFPLFRGSLFFDAGKV
ncbi:MAG TPA: BamA/TamA family outer membrane protein, partial [Candidatus Bathyarchaeia archaeon]|nr:BamA/TamA family outer membrane protein [Candidatus Bathyarchaeia archaeon]